MWTAVGAVLWESAWFGLRYALQGASIYGVLLGVLWLLGV